VPNPASPLDAALYHDGALDDTVLEVFDTTLVTPAPVVLCPADDVAVAGGMAAFLRPEAPLPGTAACPGGSLNPAADAATTDRVLELWKGTGPVINLGVAATAVAMSADYVAVLVSESGQGNTIMNDDGDATDDVVQVYRISDGAWLTPKQAADTVQVCGSV